MKDFAHTPGIDVVYANAFDLSTGGDGYQDALGRVGATPYANLLEPVFGFAEPISLAGKNRRTVTEIVGANAYDHETGAASARRIRRARNSIVRASNRCARC